MESMKLTIGELAVRIKSADLAAQVIDTAIASDFDVEVSYDYQAADADAGIDEAVTVNAILACSNVHFAGDVSDTIVRRGSDMLPLFSGPQVAAIGDQILLVARGGGDE